MYSYTIYSIIKNQCRTLFTLIKFIFCRRFKFPKSDLHTLNTQTKFVIIMFLYIFYQSNNKKIFKKYRKENNNFYINLLVFTYFNAVRKLRAALYIIKSSDYTSMHCGKQNIPWEDIKEMRNRPTYKVSFR